MFKGLLLLSDNCEDLEAIGTKALLQRAGIHIETATFNKDKTVKGAYGTVIKADLDALDITTDYDLLIIPGGSYVIHTIASDKTIKSVIKRFTNKDKVIAAICAAPMFLGEMGLLKDKNYTAFPGCENDAYKGVYQSALKAVTDGKIITGRSAGAIYEFAYEIVKYFKGEDQAKQLLKEIYL